MRPRRFAGPGKPKLTTYRGEADVPFYRIGDLARALNRSPGTIRKWEAVGILPRATFGMKVAEGHSAMACGCIRLRSYHVPRGDLRLF